MKPLRVYHFDHNIIITIAMLVLPFSHIAEHLFILEHFMGGASKVPIIMCTYFLVFLQHLLHHHCSFGENLTYVSSVM